MSKKIVCPNCGVEVITTNKIEVECPGCHYVINIKDYKPIKEDKKANLINLNEKKQND